MRSLREGWRLRFPIVLVPWLAGVAVYWWYMVPLVPDVVIPLVGDDQGWGHTGRGDIVISHAMADRGNGWSSAAGPVDLVSSVSGKVLARRLDEGGLILTWPQGRSHIAVVSGGSVRVVDLDSGREVVSRATDGKPASAAFSRDGNEVAIGLGHQVFLHSLKSGAELWRREFTVQGTLPPERQVPGTVIQVHLPTEFQSLLRVDLHISTRRTAKRHQFLNAKTGELDRRFGITDELIESADGPLAIVGGRQEHNSSPADQRVYDLINNRVLWTVPKGSDWCEFSPDGSEVWGHSHLNGLLTRHRWRATDGASLDHPVQAGQDWPEPAVSSEDGRYFVGEQAVVERRAPDSLMRVLKWIGIGWNGVLQPATDQMSLVLVDGWTNRRWVVDVFTPPPGEDSYHYDLQFRPLDGKRFTIHREGHIAVYRFAVPRNWWWLAGWGLGPVVVIVVVNRWRRRRCALRGAGAAPDASSAG